MTRLALIWLILGGVAGLGFWLGRVTSRDAEPQARTAGPCLPPTTSRGKVTAFVVEVGGEGF